MAFQYQSVVPWGRSFAEYQRMFALSASDLNLRIIGCADGPASFNARMAELGNRVVSFDPLLARLTKAGYKVAIERVQYEFQRGGHEMLALVNLSMIEVCKRSLNQSKFGGVRNRNSMEFKIMNQQTN